MKPILVYTTVSSKTEANSLSKILLEAKICACVNILKDMQSFFIWNSTITSSNELVLLIKTFESKYSLVEKTILQNHSYTTPAIFSIPISNINSDYLIWMKKNIE